MSKQHTPTPWRIGDHWNTIFGPPNGQPVPVIIADMRPADGDRVANAILIAKAVNSHDELLEALKGLVDRIKLGVEHTDDISTFHAEKVIKKAEGES